MYNHPNTFAEGISAIPEDSKDDGNNSLSTYDNINKVVSPLQDFSKGEKTIYEDLNNTIELDARKEKLPNAFKNSNNQVTDWQIDFVEGWKQRIKKCSSQKCEAYNQTKSNLCELVNADFEMIKQYVQQTHEIYIGKINESFDRLREKETKVEEASSQKDESIRAWYESADRALKDHKESKDVFQELVNLEKQFDDLKIVNWEKEKKNESKAYENKIKTIKDDIELDLKTSFGDLLSKINKAHVKVDNKKQERPLVKKPKKEPSTPPAGVLSSSMSSNKAESEQNYEVEQPRKTEEEFKTSSKSGLKLKETNSQKHKSKMTSSNAFARLGNNGSESEDEENKSEEKNEEEKDDIDPEITKFIEKLEPKMKSYGITLIQKGSGISIKTMEGKSTNNSTGRNLKKIFEESADKVKQNLREIDFVCNAMTDDGVKYLSNFISAHPSMSKISLDIQNSERLTISAGLGRLGEAFKNIKLKDLQLMFKGYSFGLNQSSDESYKTTVFPLVIQVLTSPADLESMVLDFSNCFVIDTKIIEKLFAGLLRLKKLKKLSLNFSECLGLVDDSLILIGQIDFNQTNLKKLTLKFTGCKNIENDIKKILEDNFAQKFSQLDVQLIW